MKKSLLALLLVLPVHAYAFDYVKFAVADTLACAHSTAKDGKAELVGTPTKQGDQETARVKIFYKGLIKANSMLVEYVVMTTSANTLIKAKILEDSSSIPAKECAYFKGWQEVKAE